MLPRSLMLARMPLAESIALALAALVATASVVQHAAITPPEPVASVTQPGPAVADEAAQSIADMMLHD